MKWCLRVCPDLAKKMGFRALMLISSSLKFIPGRSKLSGTSSLKWVWAKHFQGALNPLSKGRAGTRVQSKSWVGVEVGLGWESREANKCLRGCGQSTIRVGTIVCIQYATVFMLFSMVSWWLVLKAPLQTDCIRIFILTRSPFDSHNH